MKASIHRKYGKASDVIKIENMEAPKPKENQVIVKVKAASVNRTDCAMLLAKPFIMRFMTGLFKPRNPVLGTEFAGEVTETGANVTRFSKGDRVFGFNDIGVNSHAEFLAISEKNSLDIIPENYSFKNAAVSIEGMHYAYNFINKVNLKPGQKVLVYGASGGIGSAMIQLLIFFGADITAIGNNKILPVLKDWGITNCYDYKETDYRDLEQRFDYIFDAVGKINFYQCKHLLKRKGVYISSELGPGLQNLYLPLLTKIGGGKCVRFPFPPNVPRSISLLKELINNNLYQPVIDRVYKLDDIAEAFTYVASAKKTGNVIVDIDL